MSSSAGFFWLGAVSQRYHFHFCSQPADGFALCAVKLPLGSQRGRKRLGLNLWEGEAVSPAADAAST